MFELTPFVRRNHNTAVYNPFRDLEDLERNFFGNRNAVDFRTDITETEKAYTLEAELPGFKKEDIKIDIDNNYLTISAERKNESEEKNGKGEVIRRERCYGSVSRSFDITGVQTDNIEATYENGILKLEMPKKEEIIPKSRRLEIK
ncbi:MAG: Hsp20/alpha crystallin family protein [Clostridia bacterium]|nr:Hsp20/alpha crystallin family protein [Clostridia bacterium]